MMKPLSPTPQTLTMARRIIWFEEPEQALRNPAHLVAYAMTYGTHEDMTILRQYLSDADLREALDHAPPGIFDGCSWAYWNLKLGRSAIQDKRGWNTHEFFPPRNADCGKNS